MTRAFGSPKTPHRRFQPEARKRVRIQQAVLAFESRHGKIMPDFHSLSKPFRIGNYRGWPRFRPCFYPHECAMSQKRN